MVELLSSSHNQSTLTAAQLIDSGEAVVIVDDSPEVVLLLNRYLENEGLTVFHAGSGAELNVLLETSRIALVLLDIGLPDKDGTEILKEIVPRYPDLGIIMVTGSTNLALALDCLRFGADDYLTKPLNASQFNHIVKSTLKKRRLAIDNRNFQRQLQASSYRTQFLHHLNLKMNSVYLSTVELKGILQAILVGITSEEGLKFNRAFLALFDREYDVLKGRLAIGPASREDASRVWDSIRQKNLHLDDIITNVQQEESAGERAINEVAEKIQIPTTDNDHVLIAAGHQRRTFNVINGEWNGSKVSQDLLEILGHSSFVVVPLFSPSKSLGVIIVDNFVTHKPISPEDIHALEIFASQASLAIEHSHLYEDMREKIGELELVTQELERSKDLLIASERYSAVGHMSAQLVHVIRNPVTSIGGTARLLAKKTDDDYIINFLNIITKEAAKIESTLEDLFSFVEDRELQQAPHSLYPLIRRSVMIFYATMKNSNINYTLDLPDGSPTMMVDAAKIRQVFMHLIKNAIEAMPNGGSLSVTSRQEEEATVVSFVDSGGGLSDSNLHMASDPFFTTKTYGTGMGLTLVEKIITMHGGTFALHHNNNGGLSASVKLPNAILVSQQGYNKAD